ncbi:MAG TPA: hypothetical protein DCQ06_08005 [Myxococcales bacterium]|nr:hypothetical protein [Myxococcales bacterium]
MHQNLSKTAFFLSTLVVLSTSCEGPGEAQYPPRTPAKGSAVLPPTPDLNPKLAPSQYDDGAWSIRGVTESGVAGRGGKSLQVRGYVAKIHRCADDVKRCKPAPHVLLTDRKDLRGRRFLLGGIPSPAPGQGQQLTATGTLVTHSPDGLYVAPSGLLLLSDETEESPK